MKVSPRSCWLCQRVSVLLRRRLRPRVLGRVPSSLLHRVLGDRPRTPLHLPSHFTHRPTHSPSTSPSPSPSHFTNLLTHRPTHPPHQVHTAGLIDAHWERQYADASPSLCRIFAARIRFVTVQIHHSAVLVVLYTLHRRYALSHPPHLPPHSLTSLTRPLTHPRVRRHRPRQCLGEDVRHVRHDRGRVLLRCWHEGEGGALTHSPTHALTHSCTHSLTHSPTHSLALA